MIDQWPSACVSARVVWPPYLSLSVCLLLSSRPTLSWGVIMQVCLKPRCLPALSRQSNRPITANWQAWNRHDNRYLQQCLHSRELIISGHRGSVLSAVSLPPPLLISNAPSLDHPCSLHLAVGVCVIIRYPQLILMVVKKSKPTETAVFSLKPNWNQPISATVKP